MERVHAPALRWLRATLLTAVALGSGLLAHISAQGLMPRWPALVVMAGLGLLLSYAFLARPASRLRVVVLTVTGQLLTHATLTALSGHRGDPPLTHTTAPAWQPSAPTSSRHGTYYELTYGRAHAGQPVQASIPAPVQHLMADMTGPHAAMALAHVAAAVVVGLWLAGGERALWTLVALLVDGVRAVTAYVAAPVPTLRPTPLVEQAWGLPALPLLEQVVLRRGPPVVRGRA